MDKAITMIHKEVLRIAEDLIDVSKTDKNGRYWNTYDREPYGEAFKQKNEQIYNGVSGIALFYISLYKFGKDEKYLKIAEESLQWCICLVRSRPENCFYTFYTGATGIIYALIKLYEVSGKQDWLTEAEQILELIGDGIVGQVAIDDFLSGNAGNLFVITYLYMHTENSTVLKLVDVLLQRLIDNVKISKKGLKWGYFPNVIDSLTGVSHGASGIAHVLMEVGRAIQMPALHWMADNALQFEDEYYSRFLSGWVDMRIYPEHSGYDEKKGNKLAFYLNHKKDVVAWAHGITGMGLVRLSASEEKDMQHHKKKVERALSITLEEIKKTTEFPNFTLSTGLGSWIELLLKGGKALGRLGLTDQALSLAISALDHRNKLGMYASDLVL